MLEITETWRDVAGYEGLYAVSSLGRVMNVKSERVLRQVNNNRGYLRVQLCRNGKKQSKLVHRLVAEAFITNPNNLPDVNHISGDQENNSAVNLEFVSHAYNIKHGIHKQARAEANLRQVVENCIAEAMADEQRRIEALETRIKAIEDKAAALGIEL